MIKKALLVTLLMTSSLCIATETLSIVKSISSSTYLQGNLSPEYDYSVANLLDNDLTTAWFEGIEDYSGWNDSKKRNLGKDAQINLYFYRNEKINSIEIANGFGKSKRLFQQNGRLKKIRVNYDTGSKDFELADTLTFQTLPLDGISTRSLSIRILDAKAGSHYTDVGFSELKINTDSQSSLPPYTKKLKTIKKKLEFYIGYAGHASDLSTVSTKEFIVILKQSFDRLDNMGKLERTEAILNLVKDNNNAANLIPVLLKQNNQRKDALFIEYGSYPLELSFENILIADLTVKIAYLNSLKNTLPDFETIQYDIYHRLVELGDTRHIRKVVELWTIPGEFSEFGINKSPYELLKSYKGAKLTKILLEFQNKLPKYHFNEVHTLIE